MNTNICIPTLNRYDLLKQLIASLQQGTLKPDHIYVIDNGQKLFSGDYQEFDDEYGIRHHYIKFGHNLGCAASWNWFAHNAQDIRIVCNDDIIFEADALEKLVAAFDDNAVISPDSIIGSNSFSCFMLPDSVVAQVGLFDEDISPNYCWLEDNDFVRRMTLLGIPQLPAPDCRVAHGLSSTLKEFSPGQTREHHERFRKAQLNYQEKWGDLPGHELYNIPYDGSRED